MRKKITAVLSLIAAFTVSLFGLSACMGGTNSSSSSGSVESPFESESTPGDGSTSDGGNSSGGDNSSDDGGIPDDGSSPGDENPVPSISLDKETLSINAYTSETLTATLTNSEEIIDWTSSNEEVAKVIDGKVVAVGVGSATITVSAGDVSASCEVTVTENSAPIFTEISDTLSIIKGKTKTLDTEMTLNGEDVFLHNLLEFFKNAFVTAS